MELNNLIKRIATIWYATWAAIWTGLLIGNIIRYFLNKEPSWAIIFIALGCCVINKWWDFHISKQLEVEEFDDEI